MGFVNVIILSIVEGLTEFLPVSSTGHMILASYALGLKESEGLVLFEIVTQLGATFAIVVLFSQRLLAHRNTLLCVIVAFVPTGIVGFYLYSYITLLFKIPIVSIVSLIVGGIFLIAFDQYKARSAPKCDHPLTWRRAVVIGLLQCLAFIPGTSRSAVTILAGMGTGLSRRDAAEFSFLLAIPTMLAASGLALFKFDGEFSATLLFEILLGSIISFIVAYYSVKVFMYFIDSFGLTFFGIYRIIFALIFYVFVLC